MFTGSNSTIRRILFLPEIRFGATPQRHALSPQVGAMVW